MTATFGCRLCAQEFLEMAEAEEHILYHHDVVDEHISVHDDANHDRNDD